MRFFKLKNFIHDQMISELQRNTIIFQIRDRCQDHRVEIYHKVKYKVPRNFSSLAITDS